MDVYRLKKRGTLQNVRGQVWRVTPKAATIVSYGNIFAGNAISNKCSWRFYEFFFILSDDFVQPHVRTFPNHKTTLTATRQETNDPGNKLVSKIKIINEFMG